MPRKPQGSHQGGAKAREAGRGKVLGATRKTPTFILKLKRTIEAF
jgi:hypothetical protein